MSTWWGNDWDNTYFGNAQYQYGLGGNDRLSPSADNKSYYLYGGDGQDWLEGYDYDDRIYGGNGADEMYGYDGWDKLYGGKGNDYLDGGKGKDKLYGGSGADAFVFSTRIEKSNVDTIDKFKTGEDSLFLDNNTFDGVGKMDHVIKGKKFEIGKDATTSKVRILYNEKNGKLFYTPDGDNGDKHLFAKVKKGTDIDHHDIYIISL